MKKNPKVSVILTTYNRADVQLPRAINSVLNQTLKDFELIIVDDCSTDSTRRVCEEYQEKDKRVKYIRLPENFGSDTRGKNVGVLASHGDYIAYLDDDCEFHPYHLQVLVERIEKAPEIDLVYCDMWLYNEDKPEWPGQQGIALNHDPQFLLNRNYIDTSEVLHKREMIFRIGGFDETLKKFIDWNAWVRMTKWGAKMMRVPVIATNYYIHTNKSNPQKSHRVETESWFDERLGMTMFKPTFDPPGCFIYEKYLETLDPEAARREEERPRISVFTLTYERLDYTKRMFESMQKSAGYPFEWFVWDNGSKDETAEFLQYLEKDRDGVHIKLSKVNVGISKASNGLLDLIKEGHRHEIIIKIDNDCEFLTKDWLHSVVDLWRRNHMVYVSPYPEGLVHNPGGAPRIGYSYLGPYFLEVTMHVGGMFAAIDARAYDKFRWQDKFLHGNQDREASIAFAKMEYMPCYMPLHRVYHMDSTAGQQKKYPKYFERRIKEKQTQYEENK